MTGPKPDKPRGICPVCHRPFALKTNGALHIHGKPYGVAAYGWERCDGSGQYPSMTGAPS